LKIVLTDDLAGTSSDGTIIDSKGLLQFSKNEDLLFNSLAEFMNRIPSQVVDGKSIKEWFRLKDHSLWWFAHNALAPRIDEQIRFVISFENMLDALRPDVIDMQGFYDRADLIQQICKKKNIKMSIGFSVRNKIFLHSIKNRGVGKGSSLIAAQKRSKRISLAKEAKHDSIESIKKGCVIHVAHETYRRRIYDFKTGEIKEGEYIAQKIMQQVRKKGADILGIDVDHTAKGEFRALEQRLSDKDQYWIPFDIFEEKMSGSSEAKRSAEDLRRTLANLFKNKDFQAIFTFNGIRLWESLSIRFDLLLERLPQRVISIAAAKDLLQKLEPKSIFLLYEKGASAMTFIVAADELGIKTVGMQHGIIYEWHIDYAISDLRTGNSALGNPIPTVTVVFGEFYEKLLTEKLAYPSDRVVVGGNPSYESADAYSRQLDRKTVLSKLGMSPEKKTVLVASSMGQKKYGQPDYDIVLIQTLAKAFGNNKDIQVVMKLHPKEDGEAYKKIIDENGAANFYIIDHPIEELILVCDVFLAVATTTIMEAIVLERPVIVVKAFESTNRYIRSLIENGAAIGARYEELETRVLEVLNDRAIVEKLRKKGLEFARLHFNIPDNEISKRIADLLTGP
jgi:UDP-N-acetylglucosamine:LPS N-acetylglucosamine transferase